MILEHRTAIAQAAAPVSAEELVEGLAQTIANDALSQGYVSTALESGWDPEGYELHEPGDYEYLRGQQGGEESETLPLPDEDAQDELEDAVQDRVREILAAAVAERAEAIARDGEAQMSDRVQAIDYLEEHDHDRWERLNDEAIDRVGDLLTQEAEGLEPGEALAWSSEQQHRIEMTTDEDGEIVGERLLPLTDRDYAIARDLDGDLDEGVMDNGGIVGGAEVLGWWALGIGPAEALAEGLTGTDTALTVVRIDPEGDDRREETLRDVRRGWEETVRDRGAEHLLTTVITVDPADLDGIGDGYAHGARMAEEHLSR